MLGFKFTLPIHIVYRIYTEKQIYNTYSLLTHSQNNGLRRVLYLPFEKGRISTNFILKSKFYFFSLIRLYLKDKVLRVQEEMIL